MGASAVRKSALLGDAAGDVRAQLVHDVLAAMASQPQVGRAGI